MFKTLPMSSQAYGPCAAGSSAKGTDVRKRSTRPDYVSGTRWRQPASSFAIMLQNRTLGNGLIILFVNSSRYEHVRMFDVRCVRCVRYVRCTVSMFACAETYTIDEKPGCARTKLLLITRVLCR